MSDFHKRKAEQKKNCKLVFSAESLEEWKRAEYEKIKARVTKEIEAEYGNIKETVRKRLKDDADGFARDSIDKAFTMVIGISLRVLKHNYGFGKRKRLPEFAEAVLKYYADFQEEEGMTIEEYQDLIEAESGLRFVCTPVTGGADGKEQC